MSDYRWFVLDVNPEPWAVGPLSVGRKSGKVYPYMGRNDQLFHYKEAIKEELGTPDFFIDDAKIELQLFFWRRRDEYQTPQARTHRKHEADLTNLQKATEDALQGVLFKNDKDVEHVESWMVDQGPHVVPKVVVAIRRMEVKTTFLPEWVAQRIHEIDNGA